MEFNSQICTTREQSERLLAMGLKAETADMMWSSITAISNRPIILPEWNLSTVYFPHKSRFLREGDEQVFIPAWSLHRLMEIMYEGDLYGFVSLSTHHRNIDTIYELVIANIKGLIKINRFNPEYFEDKSEDGDKKEQVTLTEVNVWEANNEEQ